MKLKNNPDANLILMIGLFCGLAVADVLLYEIAFPLQQYDRVVEFVEDCNNEFGEYRWFVAPSDEPYGYRCLSFLYIDDMYRNDLRGSNETET